MVRWQVLKKDFTSLMYFLLKLSIILAPKIYDTFLFTAIIRQVMNSKISIQNDIKYLSYGSNAALYTMAI